MVKIIEFYEMSGTERQVKRIYTCIITCGECIGCGECLNYTEDCDECEDIYDSDDMEDCADKAE